MDAWGVATSHGQLRLVARPRLPAGGWARRASRLAIATLIACLLPGYSVWSGDTRIRFNRDVRPILAESCFSCHGPDARHRRAALRLDVEADAKARLESGVYALVAGQPDESELLARVASDDPSEQMPPPKSNKVLTSGQVELLRQWIAEGATWEGHWSLQPIVRPAPRLLESSRGASAVGDPLAEPKLLPGSPIDTFVAEKRREQRLTPAASADRVTLLRRVHFDLIGLPPAPDEVKQFLGDDSPEAYENVVERLLASPHFGERLAIAWLDLVRYADSVGYFADQSIRVSPFRDYVIGAFNANKPFDRFTIEQLAGDLLPEKTIKQTIASAYNRLGRMSSEQGVQEKEYLAKYNAERVRNFGATWLGLTLGCCECHDHKYDPLSARDFYQLAAFFADIQERGVYDKDSPLGIDWGPTLKLGTPAQIIELERLQQEIDRIKVEIGELQTAYRQPSARLADEVTAWETTLKVAQDWRVLQPVSMESAGRASRQTLVDGSVLVRGALPESDTYVVRARAPLREFTAIRLEVLPDRSLPGNGPGRGANGNFALTGFSASLRRRGESVAREIAFRSASATFEQSDAPGGIVSRVWTAASALQSAPRPSNPGWAITDETGVKQEAIFETQEDVQCVPGGELTVTLRQEAGYRRTLGRFRLSIADARRPVEVYGYRVPQLIRRIVATPKWLRSRTDKRDLADYYAANVSPDCLALRDRSREIEGRRNQLHGEVPSVLIAQRVEPRPIRVLARGNWQDETGELVSPHVPAILPQPQAGSSPLTRLDLANWIVSRNNPLTARVLVNRLWKLHFGAGLSRKVDDLGSQGEWPTHPELLDWLAGQLIDSGWDLKHTIRLIVTSETYRQSSAASAAALERDPENRWLSHQTTFRLEAELIRDVALAASGLLAPRVGGPSVFPYQPESYWDLLSKPPRTWTASRGDDLYRRGLYTHWQRQYLHPMLAAFDASSREECAADRPRSNTPLQALVLLNDPTFVEAARVLAERAIREGGGADGERLNWLYERVVSRPASPAEQTVVASLLTQHRASYRDDPQAAEALLSIGKVASGQDFDRADLAAWTSVARAVLNLQEAVIRP